MNTKNLFASLMIAGLVAGSVAKAQEGAAPAAPAHDAAMAPAADAKEKSCKGEKGCKGEHKGEHGKKKAAKAKK